jgi:hypothetical protein
MTAAQHVRGNLPTPECAFVWDRRTKWARVGEDTSDRALEPLRAVRGHACVREKWCVSEPLGASSGCGAKLRAVLRGQHTQGLHQIG